MIDVCFALEHSYFQLVNYISVDELSVCDAKTYTVFCFKFLLCSKGNERILFFPSHTHAWEYQTETKMWPNFFVTLSQRCVQRLRSQNSEKKSRKSTPSCVCVCTQLTVKLNCPYIYDAFYPTHLVWLSTFCIADNIMYHHIIKRLGTFFVPLSWHISSSESEKSEILLKIWILDNVSTIIFWNRSSSSSFTERRIFFVEGLTTTREIVWLCYFFI